MSITSYQSLGLSWYWWDGTHESGITDLARASLGRPLKADDFKEYLIMPLFEYSYGGKMYWTGAVITFVKAGGRFTEKYGSGAYVHIGARYFYDASDNPLDEDHGRGFIGTAAALLVETSGFNPSSDAKSEYDASNGWYREAGIMVHPTIIGVTQQGTDYIMRISIAFHGILKADEDDHTYTFSTGYGNVGFCLGSLPEEWSDVTMRADLGDPDVSRQGKGRGFDLSGLYQEPQMGWGLPVQSLILIASVIPDPIIQGICWGLEGMLLMSDWLSQWPDLYIVSGVDTYAQYIDFYYSPIIEWTVLEDGYRYEEVTSLVAVDVKVPMDGRAGWKILPINYSVGIGTQCNWAEPYTGDTLNIAIWFPGAGQEDAEINGDAGDSHGTARPINCEIDYYGYLGGGDNADWYKFNVNSGDYLTISMKPPPYIDFDLELYSPTTSDTPIDGAHHGPGIIEYIIRPISSSGWWRIKIYNVTVRQSGVYSFKIDVGGCPFVSVWNGSGYVLDNNLMGASEASNGTDVEDYYRLEQTLVPRYEGRWFSWCSLLISEFENEHSYLDHVKLLAVDHGSDVNVAVSPDGEILTYRDPHAPVSCVDNHGNNLLSIIEAIDDNYYEGCPDDCLILDFGDLDVSEGAKLVLHADIEFKKEMCIHVQVLNATQDWNDIIALRTRVRWATEIVDLSSHMPDANGELKVRLYFTGIHKLDYVGLDVNPQDDFELHQAFLLSAVHSIDGNVRWRLLENDNIYAELVPGEQIELMFILPRNSEETRTFIIYTEGHYEAIP